MTDNLIQATIALLAIANPLGAVPIFLGLTDRLDVRQRRHAASRASVAVFIILVSSALLGNWLLSAFGISFAAFQVAGGLVILLIGLEMLGGSRTRAQHDPANGAEKEDPVLVPFAMPMIAGPGAITTVVTFTAAGSGPTGLAGVIGAIAIVATTLFISLRASVWLSSRVSLHGHGIVLRFLGLILVALGVQHVMTGIADFVV